MLKKTITVLLCFTLPWTSVFPAQAAAPGDVSRLSESEIRAKYPNARIIRVSAEEYPALERELTAQGYRQAGGRLLASNADQEIPSRDIYTPAEVPAGDCAQENRETPSTGSSPISFRLGELKGSGGGRDGAIFLFVLIGAMVLIVWTLYAVKYLYDTVRGFQPCGRWSELSLTATAMSEDGDSPIQTQHARFNGVHFTTGFHGDSSGVGVGIAAEIGDSDIELTEKDTLLLRGMYWLLGPVLRWRSAATPHYFQMEFLAGTTEHQEMDLIAMAKLGMNWGLADGFRLGLHVGAMNLSLSEKQGIITDHSQYYTLLGVEFGYQF